MKTSSYSDYERNKLTRYQILMQRRQHIERIFWSRIQILHLIQAGVLGGTFYLTKHRLSFLAPPLLFVGIVLTVILFFICTNDWKDAKRNDGIMHNLGDSLGIRRTERKWNLVFTRSHKLLNAVVKLFIRVGVWEDVRLSDSHLHNQWNLVFIRSHKLLLSVVRLFILIDLALLWYFACCLPITCAIGWAIASTIILVILVLFTIAGKRFGFLKKESEFHIIDLDEGIIVHAKFPL